MIDDRNLNEINDTRTFIAGLKNGENDEIKGLIVERINNNYSWGVYGEFKLIIRNVDGYVNGTHLLREATEFENKKRERFYMKPLKLTDVNHWSRNDSTILLVDTLKIDLQIYSSIFIDPAKGRPKIGEEITHGTYIHPRLVNSLATWVSPSYALIVGDLMNDQCIKKKLTSEENRIQELSREITVLKKDVEKKDGVIEEIRSMYNSISTDLKISINNGNLLIQKLNVTNSYLRSIAKDIRVPTESGNEHTLLIGAYNNSTEKLPYRAVRVLNDDYCKRLNAIEKKHPHFAIVCEFSTPNPTQVWRKIKRESGIISDSFKCSFDIKCSEREMIRTIEKIVSEPENNICRVLN